MLHMMVRHRNADVGSAMGLEGTQMAKEAANITPLDDNFTCIIVVAKWRRNVFVSMQVSAVPAGYRRIDLGTEYVLCLHRRPFPLTVLRLLWPWPRIRPQMSSSSVRQ